MDGQGRVPAALREAAVVMQAANGSLQCNISCDRSWRGVLTSKRPGKRRLARWQVGLVVEAVELLTEVGRGQERWRALIADLQRMLVGDGLAMPEPLSSCPDICPCSSFSLHSPSPLPLSSS